MISVVNEKIGYCNSETYQHDALKGVTHFEADININQIINLIDYLAWIEAINLFV